VIRKIVVRSNWFSCVFFSVAPQPFFSSPFFLLLGGFEFSPPVTTSRFFLFSLLVILQCILARSSLAQVCRFPIFLTFPFFPSFSSLAALLLFYSPLFLRLGVVKKNSLAPSSFAPVFFLLAKQDSSPPPFFVFPRTYGEVTVRWRFHPLLNPKLSPISLFPSVLSSSCLSNVLSSFFHFEFEVVPL